MAFYGKDMRVRGKSTNQIDQKGEIPVPQRERRHFSLQYFTSVQFLAHALRHVIGLPQTAQGLLGRVDLLPLKSAFMGDDHSFKLATWQRP